VNNPGVPTRVASVAAAAVLTLSIGGLAWSVLPGGLHVGYDGDGAASTAPEGARAPAAHAIIMVGAQVRADTTGAGASPRHLAMPLVAPTGIVDRGVPETTRVAPTFEDASHTLMAQRTAAGKYPLKHRNRMPFWTGDHSGRQQSADVDGRRTAGSGGYRRARLVGCAVAAAEIAAWRVFRAMESFSLATTPTVVTGPRELTLL